MIVWVASYPRSGNTLLRNVLHQCLGLGSTGAPETAPRLDAAVPRFLWPADIRPPQRDPEPSAGAPQLRISFDRPFPAYLRACVKSPHLYLIKTHGLPRGDERALVVVRDGRKALTSYTHFLRANQPASQAVLLSTVLGREGYGSWSGHVTAWLALPPDQRLVIAYEELVDPAAGLLERIQAFVGATGPIRPWINPFDLA